MERKHFLLCVFGAAVGSANAASICWVERVVKSGDELKVFMRTGYERAVDGIQRADGTGVQPVRSPDGSYAVHEGDSLYLSTLPHDSCSGKVLRNDGVLGLQLDASVCMPVLGCTSTAQFVAPE